MCEERFQNGEPDPESSLKWALLRSYYLRMHVVADRTLGKRFLRKHDERSDLSVLYQNKVMNRVLHHRPPMMTSEQASAMKPRKLTREIIS